MVKEEKSEDRGNAMTINANDGVEEKKKKKIKNRNRIDPRMDKYINVLSPLPPSFLKIYQLESNIGTSGIYACIAIDSAS